MHSVRDIGDVTGKTVFVRLDLNAPINDGQVVDDFRLKKYFPLINLLTEKGARLILASHTDSEKGTLLPVYEYLKEHFPLDFISDYYPDVPLSLESSLSSGRAVLLENLRKYEGEKTNDASFAKHLASLADVYVNEAFSVSHRKHASIVGVPMHISGFAGLAFENEITNLSKVFNPKHPFLFVLGGAKFETKIPILKKFLNLADKVFVGGALANDLFKAKGLDVGHSVVSSLDLNIKDFLSEKLTLSTDVVVKTGETIVVKRIEDVSDGDVVVDVGPESLKNLCSTVHTTQFVLWNGPLGNYEAGFKNGTEALARCISDFSGVSIVGGGDTVASIARLGLNDKFTFVSTGGGAMLDYLANETLPGIEALNKSTL